MEALRAGLANYRTAAVGAGLGTAFYADNVGFAFPNNQQQWISFIVSVLLAILGILAKDATTGSRP